MPTRSWRPLRSVDPARLGSARLQVHQATQWLARAARAYVPAEPDDDHTNLGWDDAFGGLDTHPLPGSARLGLRIADITLALRDGTTGQPTQSLALDGRRDADARAWLGDQARALNTRSACTRCAPALSAAGAHDRRRRTLCDGRASRRPGRARRLVLQRRCRAERAPARHRGARSRRAAGALLAAPFRSRHAGHGRAGSHRRRRLRAGDGYYDGPYVLPQRLSGARPRDLARPARHRALAHQGFHRRGRAGEPDPRRGGSGRRGRRIPSDGGRYRDHRVTVASVPRAFAPFAPDASQHGAHRTT